MVQGPDLGPELLAAAQDLAGALDQLEFHDAAADGTGALAGRRDEQARAGGARRVPGVFRHQGEEDRFPGFEAAGDVAPEVEGSAHGEVSILFS